ncbi:SigE family RNA polymerase sigma factor [Cellulomonas sp. JZ18]|uniref:SigE family RNA polymerase sigma factor n=1 Tax=Cellulomonas sp. JZ18 TaxID=2654191 RepID=UPI0012D461B2|nr:SigE family RNA polymerase sigma factor [Cellulomonas sp. JZ18]QGQ18760.1 SigE family RNA polymerase sigma factor [Cellulomonas sp. JZ18]
MDITTSASGAGLRLASGRPALPERSAALAAPAHEHVPLVLVDGRDRDAEFTAFMAQAAPALARTAWLLCGDTHQADELVQQALVRTYLAWPRARERDPLAYARRTLANQRISTWRRRRREVLTEPAGLPEGAATAGADLHAERDQLVRALALLTPRQRRVVVLRHLEGLSEKEVADDLGVSVGTVKSTGSRALRTLRQVLERDAGTRDGVREAGA